MPLGGRQWRHGPRKLLVWLLVVTVALLLTGGNASLADVVSNVRADSNVNDDTSSSSAKEISADSTAELRSLNFHDTLTNAWDLLTTRTLRPATSTANEADDESTSGDSASPAAAAATAPAPTAAPIKAESLALSADDAVTAALKTATPTVTPAPGPTAVTPGAVPIATPVVIPVPVESPETPSPFRMMAPAPSPTPSPTASDVEASESTTPAKGGLDTEELVKSSTIKSGSTKSSFDETIVVMILGGLAVIGVVVLVMSRKISKETGDDEAIRYASSFGISRL